MPAVGMGWQWCCVDDWTFQVFSRPHTPHVCYWLDCHCSHWEKMRRVAKNGRGDGKIEGTEEKFGDSIASPTKDGPLIAQLTCSLPPSLSLIPSHLSLLPWLSARWERSFTDSWACRRFWGYLKSCQFNSCVYGLGPG